MPKAATIFLILAALMLRKRNSCVSKFTVGLKPHLHVTLKALVSVPPPSCIWLIETLHPKEVSHGLAACKASPGSTVAGYLKYGTNEPVYKTEMDSQTENRLVVAKGERQREREGWAGSLGLADVNYYI